MLDPRKLIKNPAKKPCGPCQKKRRQDRAAYLKALVNKQKGK